MITGQIRCAPQARDAQHELRALGDISLMLSSEAREVCILAQEARWLLRQARERARQQRARAAELRRLLCKYRDCDED